jgi:hypothetical protein
LTLILPGHIFRGRSQGINAEELIVGNYKSLKPIDGNIFPQQYERFKIKFIDKDLVEVFVHGMELYTWISEGNKFDECGGEFQVVLYLRLQNNKWKVYRTDQVTMSEWYQFSP